jgi:hypothetical protein
VATATSTPPDNKVRVVMEASKASREVMVVNKVKVRVVMDNSRAEKLAAV